MEGNQLLTPEQSAEYLQMHVDSVRRLLRTGKLPGVKVGGSWRVLKTELDKMLSGGSPSTIAGDKAGE